MPQAIRLTGVRPLIAKLRAFQAALPAIMETATLEAVEFVKANAQDNLQFYFNEPRHEFEPEPTGKMQYDSWEIAVRSIGANVAISLLNTHPAAAYIEFGTSAHEITPTNADKLAFIDPDEGYLRLEDRTHVSGIEETNFLSKAIHTPDNEKEIRLIYAQHLRAALEAMAT